MRFVDSRYDLTTGISTATVEHLGKFFTGTSKLSVEDAEVASDFYGCRIAHIKAEIKAYKYERSLRKAESEVARKFVKACQCYKKFNREDGSALVMFRQLNRKIKRVNSVTKIINDKLQELDIAIRQRDVVIAAMNKKKNVGSAN